MSMELCILASGSAGNCAVVRTPRGTMLIDAGIGPRTAAARLAGSGVAVSDVRAICLTHLDRDHFSGTWAATIVARQIEVHCHASRFEALVAITSAARPELAGALAALVRPFDEDEPFEPLPGLRVRAIALAHDEAGSHGFCLDGFGCRLGYATDLGRVPASLIDCFEDLDLLALESNYDPQMQRDSDRPWFLKQRIMGGRGHLSNDQAFHAVQQVLRRHERSGSRLPAHVVLLHRSAQCNSPERIRRTFGRDARIAPRLTLAEQHARTDWLRPRLRPFIGEQLALAL